MEFRSLYKFNTVKNKTAFKKKQLTANRNAKRLEHFNRQRDCLNFSEDVNSDHKAVDGVKGNRKDLLQQWREKKVQLKKNENKKKPFVVGIIHHNVGSPLFGDISNRPTVKSAATKKKLPAVKNKSPIKQFPFKPTTSKHQFKFAVKPSGKKLTIPQSPSFMSAKKKNGNENKNTKNTNGNSVASSQKELVERKKFIRKPRCRVQLIKDQKNANICPAKNANTIKELNSPLTPTKVPKENEFVISPFVAIARGKQRYSCERPIDSAKKQCERKYSSDESVNDETDKNNGAPFYKRLNDEAQNLIEKCDFWTKLPLMQELPKVVEEEIDSVVGQSRLLVKDKFEQFRALVDRFETKSDPPVTSDDLTGFWDMMYIEVEKLNQRMQKLVIRKENNWTTSPTETKVNKPLKKKVKKSKPRPQARGNFRDFIKGLKDQKGATGDVSNENENKLVSPENQPNLFDTSSKSSSSQSLLKKVLSVTTERRRSSVASALCALRSSFTGKELGISPMKLADSSINCSSLNKSILKKDLEAKNKLKKKVVFGECSYSEDILNTTFTLDESEEVETGGNSTVSVENIQLEEQVDSVADDIKSKVTFSVPADLDISETETHTTFVRWPTPGRRVTPRRSSRIMTKSICVGSDSTPRRSLRLKSKNDISFL